MITLSIKIKTIKYDLHRQLLRDEVSSVISLTFDSLVASQFYKLYLALRALMIRQSIKFQDIERNMFKK